MLMNILKFVKISFLALVGIFTILIIPTWSFAVNGNSNAVTARIELKNPVAVEVFIEKASRHPFDGMILESSFTFGGESIQDFYVVSAKDKNRNIREDYAQNRKALIADVKGIKDLSQDDVKNIESILITKATIAGKRSDIDSLQRSVKVSRIDSEQSVANQRTGKERPREARLSSGLTIMAQTQPMYMSLPTSGTSYFYPSVYGGRYTQQNMRWPANYFAPDETYEHDMYLYNFDRKTYLNGESTLYPNCYPTTTYAATSWPSASYPYLDTRFDWTGCEIDELSYTIGVAQANAIPANVNHFTYIRTANGNDISDKFKLQGQVGYRNPSICYTTWCSSPYKVYTIIPSWSTAVPGTQAWTFSGVIPEVPSNVSVTNPTATSLRVNFTDNTYDETNILIERKTGINGSWVSLGGFSILNKIGNWYWVNTGLSSQITYCYRLKAVNSVGSSPYSNEACGTTL